MSNAARIEPEQGLSHSPRATCARCRRPTSVCYCAHLTSIPTKTRVVLLQHPRERDVPIGTARMASLCLPNAEINVGVKWSGSATLARATSDPERPAVLLYPGAGAIDVVRDPPRGPVTLVVVDGTWWQTKKVVRENPELAALPRYAFTPPSPSEYRIRREPSEECVSTIEALVHVLGALEGDAARFDALLIPFRAMIDAQLACAARFNGGRERHKRAPKPPAPPRIPALLRDRAADVVCVVGEANAWPYRSREHGAVYEDELVHWAARRLRTGEMFELVVAPRNPLAPRTPSYVGLANEALTSGATAAELCARWRAFVRDDDVVCSWGRYAAALFAAAGGVLPEARLDLRQAARVFAKGKVGTLEEFVARIGVPEPTSRWAAGRAGLRLSQVSAIAQHFAELART